MKAYTKTEFEEWRDLLNGHIVFINGNRDDNNGVKGSLEYAIFKTTNNVGADVNKFHHVRLDELIGLASKYRKERE